MLSKLLPLNIQTQGVSWNIPIATMILRKEDCCLQTWLNLWPCLPIAMPGTPRSEPRPGSTQHKKEQEPEAGMETSCSTFHGRRGSFQEIICLQEWRWSWRLALLGHHWNRGWQNQKGSGSVARGCGQTQKKPSCALTDCFSGIMLPFCPWYLWLQSANAPGSSFFVSP